MVYNSGQFKMKKYLFVLSALVLFVFCGCQKVAGDLITKDFNVPGAYTELEVHNAFDVTVSDAVDVITITAGENVMPNVVVEVVENTLKIRLKPMASVYGGELKATIPYNANLTSVDLSGASEFRSEYGLEGQKVDVELSGASNFYCDIDADEVDISISGASNFFGDIWADQIDMDLSGGSNINGNVAADDIDLELSGASNAKLLGQVGMLKVDLTGASNIVKQIVENRYGLVCDQCEGSITGASNAYIHCDGNIRVSLSGASDLHYTGDANTTGSTNSGASNIIRDVLP